MDDIEEFNINSEIIEGLYTISSLINISHYVEMDGIIIL
jgi:hypothetical protein